MSPYIRRELSMLCFQFLSIWHMHFLLFAFIFFNFYLLGKKKQHELSKDLSVFYEPERVLNFVKWILFCGAFILLCYSDIQVSNSWWFRGYIYFVKSLWCGIGAGWDIKLNQLRVMKFNLPPKKSHKLTFEFSSSPLWSCQSESNLFSANGE